MISSVRIRSKIGSGKIEFPHPILDFFVPGMKRQIGDKIFYDRMFCYFLFAHGRWE